MLDKKAVLTREKTKIISLTKKVFSLEKMLIQFAWQKSYSFLIITSGNRELIHHIHCFGCIIYHQRKKKKLFNRFLFSDLYFECSSLNVSNISYSTNHLYIYYDILLQQHFYLHLLPFFTHYYHLPNINTTFLALIRQILQSQHQLFHLSI